MTRFVGKQSALDYRVLDRNGSQRRGRVGLLVCGLLVLFGGLLAQEARAAATESAKLLAPDSTAYQRFGRSVAISGDYALVGAPFDSQAATYCGAAYIFHWNGSSWTQQQKLIPTGGAAYDTSGSAVALSGNVAVLGVPGANLNLGAACILRYNGSSWVQEQKLTPPVNSGTGGNFGSVVAVSGNVVAIGSCMWPSSYSGSVHIYRYNSAIGSWALEQRVVSSDLDGYDNFGTRLALSGNTLIVGAPLHSDLSTSQNGSAYFFNYNGTSWVQQQKLLASDATTAAYFGYAVAVDGNLAAVGALYGLQNGLQTNGAAYTYRFNGSTWVQEAILHGSDSVSRYDNFGAAVAVRRDSTLGDVVLVGATGNGSTGQSNGERGYVGHGAAYLFGLVGSTWTEKGKLVPSDNVDGDLFGYSMNISGDRTLISAPYKNSYAGEAYIYSIAAITGSTADTTPPTVSITSPANGATVSGTSTIQATAGDNVGIARVDFYADSTLLGSDTTSPYSFSVNTTTLSNASHVLKAVAFDATGNNSTAQINVTVNNTTTYTITATAGSGGTITPSGSISAVQGASQTFTVAALSGYKIAGVTVDGVNQGAIASYTFSNVQANHTISASFSVLPPPTYTITATAGTGGTISPSGTVTVNQGASQTVTVAPSGGYQIQSVTVDGVNQGAIATYTFSNVQANHSISASFSVLPPTTFTLTATAGAGGTITPSGSVTVNQGTSQAFTIAANTGYHIAGVTVDGVNQGALASYTFSNVQANHTISASFAVTTFTITATAGTGGTITPSGSVTVNQGASQAFTIAPSGGYQIQSVTVDGVNQGTVASFTFSNVQANHTISTSFSQITYTLTASAATGGTVTPAGTTSYPSGAAVTLTATPNAGYQFTGWSGSLTGSQNPTTITITGNMSVTANFSVVPTADTIAPTVAIMSPANGSTVKRNVSVTVSAADNVGVTRVELYVDGVWKTTSTVAPFTTKWSTGGAAKGQHTLQCKAFDAAGNMGSSPVVTVTK